MSQPVSRRGKQFGVIATVLIILTYVLLGIAAFSDDAVLLVVVIPAGLGCLVLGAGIWLTAVIREARRKGVL